MLSQLAMLANVGKQKASDKLGSGKENNLDCYDILTDLVTVN